MDLSLTMTELWQLAVIKLLFLTFIALGLILISVVSVIISGCFGFASATINFKDEKPKLSMKLSSNTLNISSNNGDSANVLLLLLKSEHNFYILMLQFHHFLKHFLLSRMVFSIL